MRTPYYFPNSVDALARCESPSADAHMREWLRPRLVAHVAYLGIIDGVVFVLDSQSERHEADVERLDALRHDLTAVGQTLARVPLVFQCNKRDLPSARPLADLARDFLGPRCEWVPSVASTGEGVFNAIRALLSLLPNRATQEPPYR